MSAVKNQDRKSTKIPLSTGPYAKGYTGETRKGKRTLEELAGDFHDHSKQYTKKDGPALVAATFREGPHQDEPDRIGRWRQSHLVDPDEYATPCQHTFDVLGGVIDSQCSDPTRLMYTPRVKNPKATLEPWGNTNFDAPWLDPDNLPDGEGGSVSVCELLDARQSAPSSASDAPIRARASDTNNRRNADVKAAAVVDAVDGAEWSPKMRDDLTDEACSEAKRTEDNCEKLDLVQAAERATAGGGGKLCGECEFNPENDGDCAFWAERFEHSPRVVFTTHELELRRRGNRGPRQFRILWGDISDAWAENSERRWRPVVRQTANTVELSVEPDPEDGQELPGLVEREPVEEKFGNSLVSQNIFPSNKCAPLALARSHKRHLLEWFADFDGLPCNATRRSVENKFCNHWPIEHEFGLLVVDESPLSSLITHESVGFEAIQEWKANDDLEMDANTFADLSDRMEGLEAGSVLQSTTLGNGPRFRGSVWNSSTRSPIFGPHWKKSSVRIFPSCPPNKLARLSPKRWKNRPRLRAVAFAPQAGLMPCARNGASCTLVER